MRIAGGYKPYVFGVPLHAAGSRVDRARLYPVASGWFHAVCPPATGWRLQPKVGLRIVRVWFGWLADPGAGRTRRLRRWVLARLVVWRQVGGGELHPADFVCPFGPAASVWVSPRSPPSTGSASGRLSLPWTAFALPASSVRAVLLIGIRRFSGIMVFWRGYRGCIARVLRLLATQAVERDLARVGKTIERLLTAYQEDLVSLDQLRERMPLLRQREQTLRQELNALVEQTRDRAAHLRLAETLSAFLTRLRASAETLDIVERQRIVRLLVKEVLVSDDTVTIRHCIPVPSGPPPTGSGPNGHAAEVTDHPSYLLRSGRSSA